MLVTKGQNANDASTTNYLGRSYAFTQTGATAGTYSLTLNYPAAEVVGSLAGTRLNRWNGSAWSVVSSTVVPSTTSVTVTGLDFSTINNSQFTLRPNTSATYTWKGGASGSYGTAANWNPSRTTLDATDVLVFDGANINGAGGTGTITTNALPTQSIGRLILQNNANVNLVSTFAGTPTLTINGDAGTDLDIPSGSTLSLYGGAATSNTINLAFGGSNNTAAIAGTLNLGSASGGTGTVTYSTTNAVTTIDGTVNAGTATAAYVFTGSSTTSVLMNGTFNMNAASAVSVPSGTYATTSNININGATSATVTLPNVTVGNLTVNSPNIAASNPTLSVTSPFTIGGYFTMTSTGAGAGNISFSTSTINVNGATNINGGTLRLSSTTTGSTLNAIGGLTQTGGTIITNTSGTNTIAVGNATTASNFSQTGGSISSGSSTTSGLNLDLYGNFSQGASGTYTETSTGTARIRFMKTLSGAQTFNSAGAITNQINYVQNNTSGVDIQTPIALTTAAGATSFTHSNSGVVTTSGAGTITYTGASATLIYTGSTAAQTMGAEWPATSGPAKVTLSNGSTSPANRLTMTASRTLSGAASLVLTNGVLVLGSNDLTLDDTGTMSITSPSATRMIAADGTGQFKKTIPAGNTSAWVFPIGDITGTDEYSPVAITFSATDTQRTLGFRVTDDVHPSNGTPTYYLSRYWNVSDDTNTGTYTYTSNYTYTAADVNGASESGITPSTYNGTDWTILGGASASNVMSVNALTEATTSFNKAITGRSGSPTITGFTPSSACAGATITINGSALTGATAANVQINGVPVASITSNNGSVLVAVLGSTAASGLVTVTTAVATATSVDSFTLNALPTITTQPTAPAGVCSGAGTSTFTVATNGTSYQWRRNGTNLTETAPYSNVTSSTLTVTNPDATLNNSSISVLITNANGCQITSNAVNLTVNQIPTAVTLSKNPISICAGGTTTLAVTGGGNIGSNGTAIVGTGTTLNGTTAYPSPYSNYYGGSKHQMLIKASELTALGVASGAAISSLAMNVSEVGTTFTGSLSSFQISMKNTSATVLSSSSFESGLTLVYGPATRPIPTTGLPTTVSTTLATPFIWDGTSNIVVETSYSNANSGTSTDYVLMTSTDPGFVSTNWYRADSASASSILSATTPTGSSSLRPNMTLAWSTLVTGTLLWTPTTDLYTNAGATTPYTNQNLTTVYSKGTNSVTYSVASSANGCSSVPTSVTVSPNALPTIVITPSASTICTGGSGVSLTASGASTYKWLAPILGLSSSTGATVTANPTTTSSYTVRGTDSNGCINTASTTVTVNNQVVISGQPANAAVLAGQSPSFTVTATGTGLTYQWQYNDNVNGWLDLSGETTSTYTIASTTVSQNNYQYRCIVSGTSPCAPVTSSAATLIVNLASIITQPASQTVCSDVSGGVTFSVTTGGTVNNYQWQYRVNSSSAWSDLSGETASSITVTSLTATNTGNQYRVLLNGGSTFDPPGIDSNAATLTVFNAVAINTQPVSATTCSNSPSVAFTVAATGSGLAYQWQVSTNGGANWTNTGTNNATLTISSPGFALNNNQYHVIVSGTSPCSALTSSAAILTVNQVVAITTQPTSVVQCPVVPTATFTVAATGTGLTYQWQFSTNGTTWNDYTADIATNASLVISVPATFNGNSFKCIVTGATACTPLTTNVVTLTVNANFGGTYAVGTGGAYTTLTAAVAAYNAAPCFTGPVVFNLTDATYSTAETFPITINANSAAGANTLTIKPNTTATITGLAASTAIFKLNGADNVIIDGSNSGGTDRSLTISNPNTSSTAALIWGTSPTASDAATGNTIKNTIMAGSSSTTTGYGIAFGGTTVASLALAANSSNTFRNNQITAVQIAINMYGVSATTLDAGTTISSNNIGTSSAAIGLIGMQMQFQTGLTISNNDVQNISSSGSTTLRGISLINTKLSTVTSNLIHKIAYTGTSTTRIYALNTVASSFNVVATPSTNLFANNMVYDLISSSTNTTWNLSGINIDSGYGDKFYHNSVFINATTANSSTTGGSPMAAFSNGTVAVATTSPLIDVRNNIFAVSGTPANASAIAYANYMYNSGNYSASTLDYNDLNVTMTTGTGNIGFMSGVASATLGAWRTATGKEANSTPIAPVFNSSTDLHLHVGNNSTLDNLGTFIAAVTTDIDGDTRSGTTPDMGADEFTTITCASQTFTGGTATSGIASFCTTTTGTTVSATGFTLGSGTTYQWESSLNGFSTAGTLIGSSSTVYGGITTGTLNATTSYRLGVKCDGGSTTYSTVVTITKFTPAVTTVTANLVICTGQSTTLTAAGSGTYSWVSSPVGFTATTASVNVTPTSTTTYTVTGTDGNLCPTQASVTVTVNAYPTSVTITPGATAVCTDSVMSLIAAGGTITTPTTGIVGAGASTSATYSNPFYSLWSNNHTQHIILASELTALGLSAGNISSVGLDVTVAGTLPMIDLSVKIGTTTSTTMASFVNNTAFQTVYTSASYMPTVGVNTLTFTAPFNWDGTSNLVLEFCHGNAASSATMSRTVKADITTYVSTIKAQTSAATAAATTCADTATNLLTYSLRPQFIFAASTTSNATITWTPVTDLYTNTGGTTAYTLNTNLRTVYTKPSASRTYIATANNGICGTPAQITVDPIALPVFSVPAATICSGGSTSLTANGSGLNYVWSPSATLNASTGTSVTASPTSTLQYEVTGTDVVTNCSKKSFVTVTVNQPPVISSVTPSVNTIRAGQTATFTVNATGTGLTYQWEFNDGNGWAQVNNVVNLYSGATSASLTISNTPDTYGGYEYRCIVTGTSPCTFATSPSGVLNIDSTSIDTQPSNQTVCYSNTATATFTVGASSEDPEQVIIYSWEVKVGDGEFVAVVDGLDTVTGLTFSNSETSALSMSGITLTTPESPVLSFRAILNGYIPSSGATLIVKTPVAITTNPVNVTLCNASGTATFTGAASGDDLTYQWEISTNGTTWNNYAGTGATTPSISIVNPTFASNGYQYRLKVSGYATCSSQTTTAATLYINNPSVTNPSSSSVFAGNTATYTVTASGAGTTTYRWQSATTLGGTYTDITDGVVGNFTLTGANTASLTVAVDALATASSADFYRCIITNSLYGVDCSATSTGAQLTVLTYCTSGATNVADEEIYSVTVNGASTDPAYANANGCTTVAPGPGSVLSKYSNFVTLGPLTSLIQNQTVSFSIVENECDGATFYTNGVAIWIDFNQNGDFTDAGEKVFVENAVTISPRTITGTISIPATATLGNTRMRVMVVEGASGTGLTPCLSYTYGETEDYLVTIIPTPPCNATPVAGTATPAVNAICGGSGSTTISLSGTTSGVTGLTYQWYYSSNGITFSPIASASAITSVLDTGTITATSYYYCTVSCAADNSYSASSNTVTLTIYNQQVTSSTGASNCGTGTVTLNATTDGNAINWYSAITGGTLLGTGNSFTTPSISTTTSYYAEAIIGTVATGLGNPAVSVPETTGASAERGIVFTATSSGTIVSAQYYSPTLNVTNTVTVRLVNNTTGTQVGSSLTLPIVQTTAGWYTMNLNLAVTAGTTYRLLASFSQSVNRVATGVNYATAAFNNLAPLGTITSGYDSAVTFTQYNYFHNITASQIVCASARTAVVATIDPKPTAVISYTTPMCSSATNAAVTLEGSNAYTGGTYSSTAGLTINSTTGAINPSTSTAGTYVVTYTMAAIASCPIQTATTSITINTAPTSGFAYAAPFCSNAGVVTPTMTGTAGTFTSSPAGLVINSTTGAINTATSTAGTYTVTNTVVVAGCANSVSTQSITISTAVAITTNPSNLSILSGANVTFTGAATGTGLTYEWQVLESAVWTPIAASTVLSTYTYSGETSASLTINSADTALDAYQFRLVVSGASPCASATSTVATLTVRNIVITTHPVNVAACTQGANTASFTIVTTGDTPAYQWQFSTNGTSWSNITDDSTYSGATTASLSLSGLTSSFNTYQYRCSLNAGYVISNAATLTVNTAVSIDAQPSATTVCSGTNAVFSVTASGTGLSYQWESSTNGTTWNSVGTNSNTLTLTSVTAGMNNNQYRVVVSGAAPCSSATSTPVTLTVINAIAITTQPVTSTVCANSNAVYTVVANNVTAYQWQTSADGITWTDVSGQTTATLTINSVTIALNNQRYRVLLTGNAPCSTVTSSPALLLISQPIVPIVTANTAVCIGSSVLLTANGGATTGSVTTYANSFDTLPADFSTAVIGSGTVSATLNTTYKSEGSGSVLFSTPSNDANIAYSMNANVNLATAPTAQLVFSQIAAMEGPTTSYDYGYVEYSSNGGSSWTTFPTSSYVGAGTIFNSAVSFSTKSYPDWITAFTGASSLPSNSLWKTETINIPAAALTTQFRVRFRYTTEVSTVYYGWLLDNVRIVIPNTNPTTWSPTTALYTDAAATTAYTGGNAANVYAKPTVATTYTVTNTSTLGCTNSNTVTVSVNPLPTAAIGGTIAVCRNATVPLVTFTGAAGTAPYTFTYKINGGTNQTVTTTSGNSVTVSAPTTTAGTFAYSLVSVQDSSSSACSNTQTGTATITVNPLPTATISGGATVCQNASNSITFTGANGTAPYTFTYKINGGSNQTVTTTSGNSVTVSATTSTAGTFVYSLVSVSGAFCSQTQTGSTTVTVNPLPTATISGTTSVCLNATAPSVTFTGATGTAPYTFTYKINGGSDQTVTTTSGNSVTVSVPTGTAGTYIYSLVSVAGVNCSQTQTGSATVTVNAPTTGTTTISACDSYVWAGPLGNGNTYTTNQSGITFVSTNASGCPHTQTLNLTINSSTASSESVTACDSYRWGVNGTTYSESGTYNSTSTNASGCPYVQTLVLTINHSTTSTETVTSPTCGTYTWSVNGMTYTSSGTYTYVGTNAAGCNDTKVLVLTINPCESVVTVKMNIQGYYDAATHAMRTVLANEGVGSSATDVDNVTIELHHATTYALVATTTAMLQTNGNALATFSTAPVGSFYIVIKHRNSIETWSATPQTVGATPLTYDFTDSASKAYGSNMILIDGKYAIYNGDTNQDGFIEGLDYDQLNSDNNAFAEGFYATDLNGDGFVEGLDYDIINANNNNFVETSRP
ncbi:GEVED domain-containing protein [Flavobacterium sp.]|uniref:GEVED domain-containing protein n=1 Tax=Flavobacterium sp. TaxID=239 RepID=UPI0032641CE8